MGRKSQKLKTLKIGCLLYAAYLYQHRDKFVCVVYVGTCEHYMCYEINEAQMCLLLAFIVLSSCEVHIYHGQTPTNKHFDTIFISILLSYTQRHDSCIGGA